jgi:hypothetical protein
MGKLRHIAMSVPGPWETELYKYAFGMEVVGDGDGRAVEPSPASLGLVGGGSFA